MWIVSSSYLLTDCTSPVSTLSMQRCGMSCSSFQQTLCHTMSERVYMDNWGAISLNTRAAEKWINTIYQSVLMLWLLMLLKVYHLCILPSNSTVCHLHQISYRLPKLTTLTLHAYFSKHLSHKCQRAVCAICQTGQRFLLLNDKSKFMTVLQSFPHF